MTALAVRPIAEALLAHVVAYYAADGAALPTRQHVSAGDPRLAVWECEQVTVSCGGIGLGASPSTGPSTPRVAGHGSMNLNLRYTLIVVQIVRCYPAPDDAGNPPPVADLHAAGLQHLDDQGRLSQAMQSFAAAPVVDGVPYVGANVEAGAVEPVGPDGGYVAAEASLILTAGGVVP